ncbi:hypothetical protein Salat_0641300 [Sesamum alatum]|uniref:Uncharacterized protein n=1 Tax=Sesamum alatum TaxID=300844 RepID=A0AAE1YRA0_9LAMI|nr:hypothetical protein Salat_0641300 [Sesamum alatum]
MLFQKSMLSIFTAKSLNSPLPTKLLTFVNGYLMFTMLTAPVKIANFLSVSTPSGVSASLAVRINLSSFFNSVSANTASSSNFSTPTAFQLLSMTFWLTLSTHSVVLASKKTLENCTITTACGCGNVSDLNQLMARVGNKRDECRNMRMGLKVMVKEVLGKEMKKPRYITLRKWDSDALDFDQVAYAAIDAFVSHKIVVTLGS